MRTRSCGASLASCLVLCAGAAAQEDAPKRLDRLEAEIQALKSRLEEATKTPSLREFLSRMHLHGYGEVHAQFPKESTTVSRGDDEFDAHRLVLGWGYEFGDAIRFDTEVDFEHAASEIELEYAMVEADLAPAASLRAGSLLMPVGPLNEFHEPTNYPSVDRPYVERSLVPTTWQEIGAGFAGQTAEGALAYRAYVVSGLDASKFNDKDGIRGGRSKGVKAKANDLAAVGRVEFSPGAGLKLGASGYYGGADQDTTNLARVVVSIAEADLKWRCENFEATGAFVRTGITNADNISLLTGKTVGDEQQGWYAEAAFHVPNPFSAGVDSDLVLFARREQLDTQHSVAPGFAGSEAFDRRVWAFGTAYYPLRKVSFKADYELVRDLTGADLGRFNLGVAWIF